MLLGLPIHGHPVCGPVDPTGWRDRVSELIGIHPPDIGPNDKDKNPSTSTLAANNQLPHLPIRCKRRRGPEVHSGLIVAHGCGFSVLGREGKHHFLIGAPHP
jgi:hypothetical protein